MSIAGAAGSVGSLLVVGAGVRIIRNVLPRKKLIPRIRPTTKQMKMRPMKMSVMKAPKWKWK